MFKFVVALSLLAVAKAGNLGLAYSSPLVHAAPIATAAYAAPVAHVAAPVAHVAAPVAYAAHAPVAYAAPAPVAYAAPVAHVKAAVPVATSYQNTYKISRSAVPVVHAAPVVKAAPVLSYAAPVAPVVKSVGYAASPIAYGQPAIW